MVWSDSPPSSGENKWRRQGKVEIGPYSKMPRMFFGSGKASSLGASAALVLLALCEHANRNNSNTFKVSDRALASDTGLGTRTICDSRKRLEEFALLACSRQEGQSYSYSLPVFSFNWVRLEERPRKKRKPRARHV